MDLDAIVSKKAKNFRWREMFWSDYAMRTGLDNQTGDPVILDNIRALAETVLQPVRDEFDIAFSPNSVYRSPAVNASIGGAKMSQHMRGEAADIEVPTVSNYDLAKWIEANIEFDQLILEMYTPGQPNSGWVHCSISRVRKPRGQTLTYDGRAYLPGLIA